MNEFVDVAIPVGVRKTFAYSVPLELRDRIAAGMRVLVPFGRKLADQARLLRWRAVCEDQRIRASNGEAAS
mgnify:CR=1 FL=1